MLIQLSPDLSAPGDAGRPDRADGAGAGLNATARGAGALVNG